VYRYAKILAGAARTRPLRALRGGIADSFILNRIVSSFNLKSHTLKLIISNFPRHSKRKSKTIVNGLFITTF
jgi:hypothetical protein